MTVNKTFDVAIIGFGPTGATLANLLAANGLSVVIIEREEQLYPLPRAVHFDDETMRVFQTIGIANALTEKVLINPGMRFVDDNDNLLLDWPRDQKVTGHGWHASYRLHQPDLETLLRAKLDQYKNVHLASHTELLDVDDESDPSCRTLRCHNRTTDSVATYHASYVIGCDGANSTIRDLIGAGMEDFGFNEEWLVIDTRLKLPRPDLGDHTIQFCDAKKPMTYCRNPGNRRRWEFAINNEERDQILASSERVWSLLSRWVTPADAELERCAVYTFRSALTNTWRKDYLLIAGDAAHQTPPFMGQGMCTGIRDAANLAWKLISVIKNNSHPSLLDTYQDERLSHAREYIKTAIKLGKLINSIDRQSALRMSVEKPSGVATIKSIQPCLGRSSILDSAPTADGTIGHTFNQPRLKAAGQRLDDFIGYQHALITMQSTETPAGSVNVSAEQHPELKNELNALNANAVWVRPDRYIGAAGDTSNVLASMNLIHRTK